MREIVDYAYAKGIIKKRYILEIVYLNYAFDGKTLCDTMRKPFGVLAKGLLLTNGTTEDIPLEPLALQFAGQCNQFVYDQLDAIVREIA